jgi:hypothetical protein
MTIFRKTGLYAAIAITALVGTSISAAAADTKKQFKSVLQTTSRLLQTEDAIQTHGCADEPGRAPVIGVLEVTGAGDATLLGPVLDVQSHCVRADLSFFNGRFRLTNAAGQTIEGRYFGQLAPTFNSTLPPGAPPGGPWLLIGNVCISGGTAGIKPGDCDNPNQYAPAFGMTDLNTGDATIFLDQTVKQN